MLALRLGLIAILVGGCAAMPERRVEAPQQVGPALGESTAMGPSDASRPLAPDVPGGVPETVGPGMAITPPGPGAPAPTQPAEAPTTVAEERPIYILPVEPEQPPPVFQPPPPPDTYEIEDNDEEG